MNPLTIPNLPTDNLYKFCAISGLVIILFSIIFTVVYVTELQEESILLEALAQETQVDLNYLEQANLRVENKLKHFEKFSSGNNFEFPYKHTDEKISETEEFKELKQLITKLEINSKELKYKSIELKKNLKLSSKKIFNLYFIIFIGIILSISGYSLAKFGFVRWNNLVQKPNDERIRSELEKLKVHNENVSTNTTDNN